MDSSTQSNPLPEKVVRRHAELLEEILPDFSALVIQEGRPADSILNAFLRSRRELGSRDRRFLAQAVFSYFRWYGWTVNRLQLPAPEACLVGAALDAAALPQSFEYLAKRCSLPFDLECLGPYPVEEKRDKLNLVLKDLPDFEPLELDDLVTNEFSEVVDPAMADKCIGAFQQRPPIWIRCRGHADELAAVLADKGFSAGIHKTIRNAISVDPGVSLQHVLKDQAGQFVVQDLASQCVGLAAAPEKGGDWWDCCAGAGGKALHLMDLMETGKVLSTDVRAPALKELKKRARKYGIKHIRTQPFNAVNDEPFTKLFDGVLVDAPCSGWGTWNRNPDARWRTSRRDVVQCAARQLKILNNVKWCVKPGGLLIYAVCSITRPETEEVVMHFLDQHSDFRLEPFSNPLTGEMTGGQLQLWPWESPGDGMFIARLRRSA